MARDLSGNVEAIATIGFALAMSGKRQKAQGLLDQLKQVSGNGYIPPYDFALVYNGPGEANEVFTWLDRGIDSAIRKCFF